MNDKKALKLVEKAIWDWKNIHTELSDVMLYFEKTNPEAYKIVSELAEEEERLIEQADLVFGSLLQKLKKVVMKRNR